tara:strand:+ start:279 stop:653 length:375 start_codon:yes stop_codon:yes gene_type:complete
MGLRKLKISNDEFSIELLLNDSMTADALWDSTPFESVNNVWGGEIYFSTPISLGEEDSREIFLVTDVAYWPPGNALCLFHDVTPISREGEIRLASPGNLVGSLITDSQVITKFKAGDVLRITRI